LASTKNNNGFENVDDIPSSNLVQLTGAGSIALEWKPPIVEHELSFTFESSFLYEYQTSKTTFYLRCAIDFGQEGEVIMDELSEFPMLGDVFGDASMDSTSFGEMELEFVNHKYKNHIEYSLEFDIHVPAIDVTGLQDTCATIRSALDFLGINGAVALFGNDARQFFGDLRLLLNDVIEFLEEVQKGGEFYLKLTNMEVPEPSLTIKMGDFEFDMGLEFFNLANGDSCLVKEQCLSGRCHAMECREKSDVGEYCVLDDADCKDDLHCVFIGDVAGSGSLNECSPGLQGNHCWVNEDCANGYSCNGIPPTAKCSDGRLGSYCFYDESCQSGRCHSFECIEKSDVGRHCIDDGDCKDNLECVTIGNIAVSGSLNECSRGIQGNHCWNDGDCASGFSCNGIPPTAKCSDGRPGSYCFYDESCQSGRCHSFECIEKSDVGKHCIDDGDCKDELECVFIGDIAGSGSFNECSRGLQGNHCWNDGDCASGYSCVGIPPTAKCSNKRIGAHCASNLDCSQGRCGDWWHGYWCPLFNCNCK